jgi:hypothetical protein
MVSKSRKVYRNTSRKTSRKSRKTSRKSIKSRKTSRKSRTRKSRKTSRKSIKTRKTSRKSIKTRKVSKKSRKTSRKTKENSRNIPYLKYKMEKDDEKDEEKDIIQVLFSCSSYQEDSDLMKNLVAIFMPFHTLYSKTDKIINLTVINPYKGDEYDNDKSKEIIKKISKFLGLNIIVNPIVYENFYNHIFIKSLSSFFYDYVCFIGCNNVDFIFSFFNSDFEEKISLLNKKLETDQDFDGLDVYILSEKLNLFLKPCSKILFFEKGKYWDRLEFHRHLLIPEHRARKHANNFLENFKLEYIPNKIPYFIHKNCLI